jgi:hypothetical protein
MAKIKLEYFENYKDGCFRYLDKNVILSIRKLKKGYKVNHKPYDIMKERYLELMQVLKELSHLLNTDDYRAIKMHWEAVERITGSKACGHCKHVLYHNQEHRSNTKRINRE